MKNIIIALSVILLSVLIGTVLENQAGGFILGVILAIVLTKKHLKTDAKKSA